MTATNIEDAPTIQNEKQSVNERQVDPQLLERARELFEVDSINGSYPSTFLGLLYLKEYLLSRPLIETVDTEELTDIELLGNTVACVYTLLDIVDEASGNDEDITKNRFNAEDIFAHLVDMAHEARQLYEHENDWFQKLTDKILTNDGDYSTILDKNENLPEVLHRHNSYERAYFNCIDALTLVHMLSGNKAIVKVLALDAHLQNTIEATNTSDKSNDRNNLLTELIAKVDRTTNYLNELAALNPSSMRRNTLRQIDTIRSGQFDVLLPLRVPRKDSADENSVTLPDIDVNFEFLQGQELNFQILPSDMNLRALSEDIYAESTNLEKVRVDLGRVQVLEDIRQLFGKDKCYFARGIRSGVTYANDKNERIDEDFIVLVMQNHDARGLVISEDALAISPISRRHAAFYIRQEASEGLSWREIFGLSKTDAKDLGARKLKFVGTEELDPYEAMREKIFTLAAGRTEDFGDELRYDFAIKQYVLRKARLRAGMAASATNLLDL